MSRYIAVVAWTISLCTIVLVMAAYWVVDRRLDRLEELPPVSSWTGKVVTIVHDK